MGIIFFSSNLFTRSWIFGEFGCKFSLTTDVLCTVVSIVLIEKEMNQYINFMFVLRYYSLLMIVIFLYVDVVDLENLCEEHKYYFNLFIWLRKRFYAS